MICAKFGWNLPSDSGVEDFFKNLSMYFRYFVIISPLENDRALHLKKKLNSLHPKMICAKFGWNLPSDSGVEDFL